jgi:integrase
VKLVLSMLPIPDLREAQQQLGHKSVKTTEIYLRARAGEKVTPTK